MSDTTLDPEQREAMRRDFERWIAAPPYERGIERLPVDSAWPGSYVDIAVDLAWEAWQAATAATPPAPAPAGGREEE